MKRIIFSFLCCGLIILAGSCKNTKSNNSEDAQSDDVKVELSEAVLETLDGFADIYFENCNADNPFEFNFTEEELLVKPDFLLDPSIVNNLLTKRQKVTALAYLIADLPFREIFNMPTEESDAAIARLLTDLNYPIIIDTDLKNVIDKDFLSGKIREEYNQCKERGELSLFWLFQNASMTEMMYIFSQNPDVLCNKLSDTQWSAFQMKDQARLQAMRELAQYDEDMAETVAGFDQRRVSSNDAEGIKNFSTVASSIEFFKANKEKFAAGRENSLK